MVPSKVPIEIDAQIIDRALREEKFVAIIAWCDPRTDILRVCRGCIDPDVVLDVQKQFTYREDIGEDEFEF
jgi:hypothetical protein